MSQFFESIKLLDGNIGLLELHQERVNKTTLFHFGENIHINLQEELSKITLPEQGLFKVKISYSQTITNIEIAPYSLKNHTKIKIIQNDIIQYAFKTTDRSVLHFESHEADDVIFVRENYICDASYSNIAFYDGNNWTTPNTYLLAGVKRSALISQNKISPKPICIDDLENFYLIAFINAMRDFEKIYTFVKKGDYLILDPVI